MKKVISLVLVILTLFSVMSLSVSAIDSLCPPFEHDWYEDSRGTPNCKDPAYIYYKCNKCVLGYKAEKYADTIPHKDDNHDGECDVCKGDSTVGCKCNCHLAHRMESDTAILIPSVFFSVVAYIFRQLFKINHYCECGFYEIYK